MQKKYFHKNFEKESNHVQKKTEFLAFRLESNKLIQLKEEASQLGLDLSELIRRKLENDSNYF